MKVTILGNGNVAEAFADAIARHCGGKAELGQLWSRSGEGRELASRYGAQFAASPSELTPADVYIIAVSDSAIGAVSEMLEVSPGSAVVHTSGGTPMDSISERISNRGVIYPLQTFSEGRSIDMRSVPLLIEYNSAEAGQKIRELAWALSRDVREASSETRNKLHIAAVFASNFTNHLYSIARDIAAEEGFDFSILKPLIEETTAKALAGNDPARVQTGPAARGDGITLQRHIELLGGNDRSIREKIYRLLSNSIGEMQGKKIKQ